MAQEDHGARLLSAAEDAVAPCEPHLRERLGKDPHARLATHEEGMHGQVNRERLVLQLIMKWPGEQREELDILGLHALPLLRVRVLQVALDPHGEAPWHLPVPQIPAQQPKLSRLVTADVPQLGHGGCEDGDEGREGDHGKQEHDDREKTLRHVVGDYLHRGGRKLRKRPVKRCCVAVQKGPLRNAILDNPARLPTLQTGGAHLAYAVPAASHDVVGQYQDQDDLGDPKANGKRLRVDLVLDLLEDTLDLEEPDESQRPHKTQRPE
mmetsp:Transcript_111513/g.348784  ORF Transcript_111513/g.348784 Transcript_111513/m.348784 type:complete len:266 (-) Transcript_111513:257-1054(-)